MANQLILASSSPRRLDLLRLIGVHPTVISADIDETVIPNEAPTDLVLRLCQGKSAKVGHELISAGAATDSVIVAADTIVVVDGDILNKPVDRTDARSMLNRISGRTHMVLTGVSVISIADGEVAQCEAEVDSSQVTMRALTVEDIDQYIDSGEPFGKAGAYAIQGYGAVFVTSIQGSFHNVMGLPLHLVEVLLGRVGQPLLSWVGST